MTLPIPSGISHLKLRLLALAVQAIVLAVGVWHHEPWADEAQAWLLARDSTPVELIVRNARYEGSPPLWHLLLMVPAKAGLPYNTLNWISAAAAWAGSAFFVLSPAVPLAFCLVLPFTYFFAYQFAVVARSYALLLPLLGLLVHARRRFAERPARFYSTAILLSWTSLHGAILAGAILVERLWTHRELWRRQMGWLAAVGVSFILIAAMLWIPGDYYFPRFRPDTFELRLGRAMMVILHGFWEHVSAILALLVSVLWFRRSGAWVPFLLGCGLLGLVATRHVAPWQCGATFLLWIYCLWIGYQNRERRQPTVLSRAGETLLFGVMLVHVYYAASAYRHDLGNPYSGSRAAAEYLHEVLKGDSRVFGSGYSTTALQPYFRQNLFANFHGGRPPAYWTWSIHNELPLFFVRGLGQRPDFIVLASWPLKPPGGLLAVRAQADALRQYGYSVAAVFPGRTLWYDREFEDESYVILQRSR